MLVCQGNILRDYCKVGIVEEFDANWPKQHEEKFPLPVATFIFDLFLL